MSTHKESFKQWPFSAHFAYINGKTWTTIKVEHLGLSQNAPLPSSKYHTESWQGVFATLIGGLAVDIDSHSTLILAAILVWV